jgi:hypothetical protein
MKITIESTPKIITLVIDGNEVPARVWQGATELGIPVQCFIASIAPEIPQSDPNFERLTATFERELVRQSKPRLTVEAIPLRMII